MLRIMPYLAKWLPEEIRKGYDKKALKDVQSIDGEYGAP